MQIPDRLGGSAIIASHIRIPEGGPVGDSVHFHRVGFQLIFCYKGWVEVVYEDQGGTSAPFLHSLVLPYCDLRVTDILT